METNNKLREALTKILDLTNSLDEECAVDPVEICDIAKSALAEPVRNYEVGTAEEQDARFVTWRYSKPLRTELGLDALEWTQMPYEEGGAK